MSVFRVLPFIAVMALLPSSAGAVNVTTAELNALTEIRVKMASLYQDRYACAMLVKTAGRPPSIEISATRAKPGSAGIEAVTKIAKRWASLTGNYRIVSFQAPVGFEANAMQSLRNATVAALSKRGLDHRLIGASFEGEQSDPDWHRPGQCPRIAFRVSPRVPSSKGATYRRWATQWAAAHTKQRFIITSAEPILPDPF